MSRTACGCSASRAESSRQPSAAARPRALGPSPRRRATSTTSARLAEFMTSEIFVIAARSPGPAANRSRSSTSIGWRARSRPDLRRRPPRCADYLRNEHLEVIAVDRRIGKPVDRAVPVGVQATAAGPDDGAGTALMAQAAEAGPAGGESLMGGGLVDRVGEDLEAGR